MICCYLVVDQEAAGEGETVLRMFPPEGHIVVRGAQHAATGKLKERELESKALSTPQQENFFF